MSLMITACSRPMQCSSQLRQQFHVSRLLIDKNNHIIMSNAWKSTCSDGKGVCRNKTFSCFPCLQIYHQITPVEVCHMSLNLIAIEN